MTVIALVSLAGCAEQPEGPDIPPELESIRELVGNCMQDVQQVPLEHSEHCVIVAETIFDHRREECDTSRSYACMRWKLVRTDIHLAYHRAVAESLYQHGRTDFFSEAEDAGYVGMMMFDGERIRSYFDRCLATEADALAERGLRKATGMTQHILAEGQLCFRQGYPEFRTAPLNPS